MHTVISKKALKFNFTFFLNFRSGVTSCRNAQHFMKSTLHAMTESTRERRQQKSAVKNYLTISTVWIPVLAKFCSHVLSRTTECIH